MPHEKHTRRLLWLKVQVLRRVSHPCLITLLGIDVQRSVIVLELASHGSLRSLFINHTHLSRLMKHRIAFQVMFTLYSLCTLASFSSAYNHMAYINHIQYNMDNMLLLVRCSIVSFMTCCCVYRPQLAAGLGYLHACDVIYRDMKPDNVLIFSLQPSSLVTVSLLRFEISHNFDSITPDVRT